MPGLKDCRRRSDLSPNLDPGRARVFEILVLLSSTLPAVVAVERPELARNKPDSQVHHLPRAYDDGLPSSAIRLRM